MSVEDYIKEVTDHRCGIPSHIMVTLKHLHPQSPKRFVDMTREMYDRLLRVVEDALAGKDIPVEDEEKAAEMVSHLIIDLAFIHDCLCRAAVPVEFPYNRLAERILPAHAADLPSNPLAQGE